MLTVTAVNDLPTISRHRRSDRPPKTRATGALAFTVGDAETAAGGLTVTAASDNRRWCRSRTSSSAAAGANRTVTVTPAAEPDGHGDHHADGHRRRTGTATDTFVLTVTPVNDAPTISDVADQTTAEDTATAALAFTVGDVETPAASLTRHGDVRQPGAGAASRTSPSAAAGADRTVTVTPGAEPDRHGDHHADGHRRRRRDGDRHLRR